MVEIGEVLWNVPLGPTTGMVCVRAPSVARLSRPGQFVHLRLTWLLRRPFSIAGANADQLCVVYQVVGEGTRVLRSKRKGQTIEVLGPLGKPFAPNCPEGLVFVSGGAGLGGVLWPALAQASRGGDVMIVHGQRDSQFMDARAAVEAVCDVAGVAAERIRQLQATDDGSAHFKGTAVGLLEELWATGDLPRQPVLGCGPRGMLAALKAACAGAQVKCYLGMEERMGCGFGTCLGCAVPMAKGGYAHVCTDGPIFPGEEVVL
ncbi:MAG: hypothetical protein ACPLPR_07555 [Bacillota bacterium]